MLETDTLYYGDCLDWMGRWDDQSVDLIYLDPPFNSNADYNILYSSDSAGDAQFRAFSDTWTWDEAAADRFAAYEGAIRPVRPMMRLSGCIASSVLQECWPISPTWLSGWDRCTGS